MVYRYGVGGQQYVISKEQYFTLRNTPREQREQRLREWGIIPAAPPVPTREDVIAQQQLAEAEAEKIRKLEWIKQQEQKGAILSPTLKEKIAQAEGPRANIIAGEETTVSPGVAHKLGLITKAEYEKEKNTSAFYVVRRQKERNILEPSQRIIEQPEESFPRLLTQSIMESGHKTTEFVSPTMTKQELLQKKVYAKAPLWMKYASEFTRQSSPIVAATSLIAPSQFVTPKERFVAGLGLGLTATLPFAPVPIAAPILIGTGAYTVATQYPAAKKGDISAQVSTVLGAGSIVAGSLMLANKIISSMKKPESITSETSVGEAKTYDIGKGETVKSEKGGIIFKKGEEQVAAGKYTSLQRKLTGKGGKSIMKDVSTVDVLTEDQQEFIGTSKQLGISQTKEGVAGIKTGGFSEIQNVEPVEKWGLKWYRVKGEPFISRGVAVKTQVPILTEVLNTPVEIPTGSTESVIGVSSPNWFKRLHGFEIKAPATAPPSVDIIKNLMGPTKPFTEIQPSVSPTMTALTESMIGSIAKSQVKPVGWDPIRLVPAELVMMGAEPQVTRIPPSIISNTAAFFSRVGTSQPKYLLESRVISKQRELTREEQESEMMKVIGIGVTGTKVAEKEKSRVGMGVGIISAPIQQQIQKQQQALQTALRYNVSQQQRARVTGVGKVGRVYPKRVPGRVIVPEFELENLMFGKRKFRPGAYRYFERNWPVATTPEEISIVFGFDWGKKKKKR